MPIIATCKDSNCYRTSILALAMIQSENSQCRAPQLSISHSIVKSTVQFMSPVHKSSSEPRVHAAFYNAHLAKGATTILGDYFVSFPDLPSKPDGNKASHKPCSQTSQLSSMSQVFRGVAKNGVSKTFFTFSGCFHF